MDDRQPEAGASTAAVLRGSTFRVEPGHFVYAQARSAPRSAEHLMVSCDEREVTVVTRPENLASVEVIRTNPDRWVLLSIDCASPFYCVGFLAAVARELSARGVDILVVSTFSRDLVLVKEADVSRAKEGLLVAGLKER